MAEAVPYTPLQLSDDERTALAAGFRRVTENIPPRTIRDLITADQSLYDDFLWPLERMALVRFLRDHRDAARRLALDDLLALLGEAQPDFHAIISEDGGRQWLAGQWRQLLSLV